MCRRQPRNTRTETPFPSTPLVRSSGQKTSPALPASKQRRHPQGACVLEITIKLLRSTRCGKPQTRSPDAGPLAATTHRSEEHTSELKSLMRISSDVFCLKKKNNQEKPTSPSHTLTRISTLYT